MTYDQAIALAKTGKQVWHPAMPATYVLVWRVPCTTHYYLKTDNKIMPGPVWPADKTRTDWVEVQVSNGQIRLTTILTPITGALGAVVTGVVGGLLGVLFP